MARFDGYGMPVMDFSSLASLGQSSPQPLPNGIPLSDVGLGPASAKSWAATALAGSPLMGRDKFLDELADPTVRQRLAGITHAEVGGQGPDAQQAFMETIFNRAAARGQTLKQTLSGSYFPDVTYQRAARGAPQGVYEPILEQVLQGSNKARYATGNASGGVGFAGGPQTSAFGGERFGVEGPDRSWAARMGFK